MMEQMLLEYCHSASLVKFRIVQLKQKIGDRIAPDQNRRIDLLKEELTDLKKIIRHLEAYQRSQRK